MDILKQLWMKIVSRTVYTALLVVLAMTTGACAQAQKAGFRFDFGPGKIEPGYTQVLPDTVYSTELGYGFDGAQVVAAEHDGQLVGGELGSLSIFQDEAL